MGQIMHIGKNWPVVSIHYCGWDKECRDLDSFIGYRNRRLNLGFRRHFWWVDLVRWSDRGSHHRTPEDYRRLRQGLSR